MKVIFNKAYDRKRSAPEQGGGELLVEVAGYVPAKKRIESLMLAGQRLALIREEQYDNVEDIDPTREKNYDMVDAQRDLEILLRRREEREKAFQTAKDPLQEPQKALEVQTAAE